ncbi:glyoxylase-like metal-dependent hydrolase (beta-lactamase superfamily II)/alkylhydroperoxidase family enzyme [Thermocatellispora tengchongensis]|uniref:Glyoxylase-like metal-dependent hydrolase (Beta-lactamase superfamily II)/alkylhydroperoxidase family enzyme n=1 Tax=Thermocatellispora tengchongensis TaxID=1073253 RepID=A0A840PFW7_9ACTN|nr:carboxymuconolactone decarboxylase family protein [Thermocatellispora tengchongensis]MBB5136037.1 glyoxylase-like metal-dependent hydrolase (beta-lactamase superfamily II)/alkylhydroperoxidase family enzyme [Thermocatellispora tengchongensis]
MSRHVWAGVGDDGRQGGNHAFLPNATESLLVNVARDEWSTRRLAAALTAVLPGASVGRVVVTDAASYRTWGHRGLAEDGAGPAFLVSDLVAAELRRRPAPPAELAGAEALLPAAGFGTGVELRAGGTVVELMELGPAFADGNTVVWVPEDRTLITGDVVCAGTHPAAWSGSLPAWHAACERLAALRPAVVVPGHGPVTGHAGLIDFRDYLEHLLTEVDARFARGMPVEEAAVDIPLGGWSEWAHPENLAVTVATRYRELGATMSESESETVAAEIAAGLRPRPRIAPLPPGERDARTRMALGVADGDSAIFEFHRANLPNIHTTLVRHPDLYEQTVPIARGVVSGVLPPRDRELTILRSAWRCGAVYQWSHHRHVALGVGLTEAEIDLLSHDIDKGAWAPHEAAVLSLVDELNATAAVTEETWAALAAHFTTQQLIELVTLVGEYHKVSFQLNAWRVPVEAWVGPIRLPSGWPGLRP